MSPFAAERRAAFAAALVALLAALLGACADRDAPGVFFEDGGGWSDAGAFDGGGGGAGTAGRHRDGGFTALDGGADGGGGGPPILPPEVIVVEALSMVPARGPSAGGTAVTITGRGFVPGTLVTFGGAPLLDLVISGERRISGKTPIGAAGVAPVLVSNFAGTVEVAGGFTYVDDVTLRGVSPARGPITGGTRVQLTGSGFVAGTMVLVGARPAFDVVVASGGELWATTPAVSSPGAVSLAVVNRNGSASLAGAFAYTGVAATVTVRPTAGPLAGGNTVQIIFPTQSFALDASARVFFGERQSPRVTVRSSTELEAVVPAGVAPAAVAVAVSAAEGSVLAPAAYAYFGAGSDLAVQAVVPASGSTAGGADVRVIGTGFTGGVTEVRFGATPSSAIGVESANVLRVTTPAGAAGPVSVTVAASGGRSATLPQAFTYESRLGLSSVSPAEGSVVGGTVVELLGEGFTADTQVFFGPIPASSAQLLDAGTLRVRSPRGAAGPVDVTVRRAGASAAVAQGFRYYDETRLLRAAPERGGIAGGTFVTLLGTGFSPSSRAFFNGVAAVEVRFVDAATLTVRTPPGAIGRADVAVLGERGAAVLPRAYEYFDPTVPSGGTAGGSITGTVNVTVFDGQSGERLSGAYATLATSGATLYQGLTDHQGQVTFSGPGLAGRQVVTAAKAGYDAATVLRFDAENVTVFINPLSSSFGLGPGAELGIIRGTIRDAFKAIPPPPAGYHGVILVTTTLADRFTPNPNASGVVQVVQDDGSRGDRAFSVKSRAGDLAVYALAGHLSISGAEFIPYQFGIQRFLRQAVGGIIEGVVIELGTSMTATLDAPLLNAPPLRPDGPNVYRMRVFLELGSDGVVTFFQLPQSTLEPRLRQEHLVPLGTILPGAKYTVVAGAYNVVDDQEYSPLVVYTKKDVVDLSGPVPIGPMMSFATPIAPRDAEFLDGNRFVWGLDPAVTPAFTLLYVLQQAGGGFVTIWEMIVPGEVRSMDLPDLHALAGLDGLPAGEVLFWVIMPVNGPSFDIDSFNYNTFGSTEWTTYSIAPYVFLTR